MELRELNPAEHKRTHSVLGAALTVHREFGPGLLESAYEECLAYELGERGLFIERQPERPLAFKGIKLSIAYRPDLIIERTVVVELKTVERFIPVHTAQLL